MVVCDFVLDDYIDVVVVVCGHVCCCYVCGDCGDILVCRKCMIVGYSVGAEWMVMLGCYNCCLSCCYCCCL